jgi:hypothetical protein
MKPHPKFAQRVFFFAALYGFLALIPQYFMEAKIGRDFPPAITHPEQFYGFLGVALAWQLAFLLIARDVVRYRAFMLPAVLEKLAFSVPAIVLYAQGRVHPVVVGAALMDLVLAALFFAAYRATDVAGTKPGVSESA